MALGKITTPPPVTDKIIFMTEQEKVNELMKPRYKVIADWPGRQFFLTAILNIHEPIPDGRIRMWIEHNDQKEWYLWNNNRNGNIDDYPHLFRKLEWWEERKPEEMPEYVKYAENGVVAKVNYFDLETTSAWFMYLEGGIHPYCPGGSALANTHWLPATSADYQAFITKPVNRG